MPLINNSNNKPIETSLESKEPSSESKEPSSELKEPSKTIGNCWICYQSSDIKNLIKPCKCKGSLQYVHEDCLKLWLKESDHKVCPQCKYKYEINIAYKSIIHKACDSDYIPIILSIIIISVLFFLFHRLFTSVLNKTKLKFKTNLGINTRFIPTASFTYLFTEIEVFGLCLTMLYLGAKYVYRWFGGDLESDDCLINIISNTWEEIGTNNSNTANSTSFGMNIDESSLYTYPIDVIFTCYKSFKHFFHKKQKKWIQKQVKIISYQKT